MRQPRLRGAASLAAVVIGTSGLLAACGQVNAGSSASSGTSASVTTCAKPPSASGHQLSLSNPQNGKVLCAKVGTGVLVALHGTAQRRWAPIKASSAVLEPHANGRMMLALGVTGGYFLATRPGTVVLSSVREVCPGMNPGSTGPATSGSGHCTTLGQMYRVTLVISR